MCAAVDLVEIFNARTSAAADRRGRNKRNRVVRHNSSGRIAHTLVELIRNQTSVSLEGDHDLKKRLLQGPRSFTTHSSFRLLYRYSQVVKRSDGVLVSPATGSLPHCLEPARVPWDDRLQAT